MASAAIATRDGGRFDALRPAFLAAGRFALMVAATLLGLLAVTFFIGRVVPIDPVRSELWSAGTSAPACGRNSASISRWSSSSGSTAGRP